MSITTRLVVFVAIAAASVFAWQWSGEPPDVTQLAMKQFDSDASLPADLQQASLAQNWWPLLGPALVILLGLALFWDEIERLWQHADANKEQETC
jgi:hypothetical protein